jgi:tetratricopeptide (TPR) repeat protein
MRGRARREGLLILCALAGGCVAAAGCATRGEPPRPYLDLMDRGQTQMLNYDYAGGRATFLEVLSRYADQPYSQDAELLLSDCEHQLGNELKARSIRERVAQKTTSPDLKARALFGLGNWEIEKEEYQAAAERFREVAKLEVGNENRAKAFYWAGLALQRGGRFAEARSTYRQVIELAPASKPAAEARRQLLYPDYFAVQTGAFADAANAARQRDLLVEKGFPAEVVTVNTAKGKLHWVQVGRFPDRSSAAALRERIRAAKVLPESAKVSVRP